MSNMDTVKQMYEAFGRGDVPAILEKLDENVEWDTDYDSPAAPWLEPRRGRDNIAGFFEALAPMQITKFEPHTFGADGALIEALGTSVPMYESGDKAGAVDTFLGGVCGKDYRRIVETRLPGAMEQADDDADAFFTGEFPAIAEWQFTKEDAACIKQPVLSVVGANTAAAIGLPVYTEIHQRVLEWFANAKPFVLPRAAHLLQVENPRDMAEGLAAFLADS